MPLVNKRRVFTALALFLLAIIIGALYNIFNIYILGGKPRDDGGNPPNLKKAGIWQKIPYTDRTHTVFIPEWVEKQVIGENRLKVSGNAI